jgi:hypothetical protein
VPQGEHDDSVNPGMLIGTRALLGIAGATLMPSTLAHQPNDDGDDPDADGSRVGAGDAVGVDLREPHRAGGDRAGAPITARAHQHRA